MDTTLLGPLETRNVPPIELPNDPPVDDDPIVEATRAVQDLTTRFEEFRTRNDERFATELRALTTRIDAVETRTARPGVPARGRDTSAELEQRAFIGFIRSGRESLAPEEVRALRVADGTAGGYLVPDQFIAELIRNLVLVSPVRQYAPVANTSHGSVVLPKETGTLTAEWVGETEDSPETAPSYGQVEFPIHEISAYVDLSNSLLEDSAIDLPGELARRFSVEFGRLEGASFISGNAVKKPRGLLNTSDIPFVLSGAASSFDATNPADNLIDLYHGLPSFYAANAVWGMNRTTMGAVRKMKASDGHYLWREPLSEGNPPTILGRPVVELPDLPDVAAGTLPILFGDFMQGFRIFDRVGLSILRDPFSLAKKGIVRFIGRRRVGGGVSKAEAFRFLKIAAS